MTTIFSKIISKDIPADIIYEDEVCLCFKDINPKAPIHYLLIPKVTIKSIQEISANNSDIVKHMFEILPIIAKKLAVADKGYRIISNCREYGGQTVDHLHFHILGGKQLGWSPA